MRRCAGLLLLLSACAAPQDGPRERRTRVSIAGDAAHINGKPTYEARASQGKKIEGLRLNSRMVQASFDAAKDSRPR